MRWKLILAAIGLGLVALVVILYAVLASYDFNDLKPRIARAVQETTGRRLNLGGQVELRLGWSPVLAVEKVSFQNAAWGARPDMASVKRLEMQVSLLPLIRGRVEIKRLILIEPEIWLEVDKSGRSNLDFEAEGRKPEPGSQTLPALSFNQVRLERGRLNYRDARSGLNYPLALDSLTAAGSGQGPIDLLFQGSGNGQPLEVSGSLGPLAALLDPTRDWPMNLTARTGGTELALSGSIKDPRKPSGLDLTFEVKGPDLADLARLASVSLPSGGPFLISGRLTGPTAGTYQLTDLKLGLGQSQAAGRLEMNLAGPRPRLSGDLTAQDLNLRPFLGQAQPGGAESRNGSEKVFPAEPLPFMALGLAEARLKLKAGQVRLPQAALSDLSLDLDLEGGRLRIDPLKCSLAGGTVEGRLDLRTLERGASAGLAAKIRGLDLAQLLKQLEGGGLAEGRLDADLDLTGRGASVAELMAGLDGRTSAVMGRAKIDNRYLDLLGADLATSALKLINPLGQEKGYTEANCLVSRFEIKDGLARSTALVLDTREMTLVGQGQINLKTEELDLAFKSSPKKGLGQLSLSLGELARPFKLAGTLARPSLAVDPAQTALALGKAVGGTVLFGPVGVAAALLSGRSGDENPCLAALEAARKGVKVQAEEKNPVEKAAEGVGRGLKKLFGN